ncbi:aminotransferase class IV [Kosmotoga arenicorallina S304]|uniref:Aminotransferase class IV n=1 Tax=Kosmotoga arenicorallina S304 TaxID=1453497 RepID=A0A176JZ95_9BACT|nr:aminotransferase class IV [Kosmotoga arenicorallina]OAA29355.1 aminotransferase class IV [Kosmotoga arenicorallina S304]
MKAFLNGAIVEKADKMIPLEDRGLTFGDGLFEVLRVKDGHIFFFEDHLSRMRNSAEFFGIPFPYSRDEIKDRARELIALNGINDGELYIELTRGVDQNREHKYPPKDTPPTFFMLAIPLRDIDPMNWKSGAIVFSFPDLRHGLCEHKTINLLPNVLAKNYAYQHGGYEALMYREDLKGKYVTEGGSSNYFFVSGNIVITPEIDNLLPGITRSKVIERLKKNGVQVIERRIYHEELKKVDEVFLVSTVSMVMPVRMIDGKNFKAPGQVTKKAMLLYQKLMEEDKGQH